jgi:hypothetical protein
VGLLDALDLRVHLVVPLLRVEVLLRHFLWMPSGA